MGNACEAVVEATGGASWPYDVRGSQCTDRGGIEAVVAVNMEVSPLSQEQHKWCMVVCSFFFLIFFSLEISWCFNMDNHRSNYN